MGRHGPDLAVALSGVREGCDGRYGDYRCRVAPEYRATLAYCSQGDAEHGAPTCDHGAPERETVRLCRRCAAVVRGWPVLERMSSL